MRRSSHLKKHNNILKRLLVHTAGFNLALTMCKPVAAGKPRRLQGLVFLIWAWIETLLLFGINNAILAGIRIAATDFTPRATLCLAA